ncbi:S53 family peptidase [Alicyclobacillus dauci]|uniref:S53 family peptidase n=1 Tax=Alicyclobacillus dauci TaxID=1475485 RepID=A0ABY6Z2L7_9BACL|nr:S53 family peptidase [Alicyclobacillus dauci]WAH36230.1 S53 family peptidase [Alicyclobacillus dauci]
MKKWKLPLLATPLTLGLFAAQAPAALADISTTSPVNPLTVGAQDLGPTDPSTTINATVVLKIRNPQGLQNYINQTVDPASPNYRKYLTVNQFRNQYAPSQSAINQVIQYLAQYGIQASAYQDDLVIHATGTVDQFQKALSFQMDNYKKNGKAFRAPKNLEKIPQIIADTVLVVTGLDNFPSFHPMSTKVNTTGPEAQTTSVQPPTPGKASVPGQLTATDAANLYDVAPLYKQGITGKGQTIGIATLANFVPQDAYDYWDAIGLKSAKNRISQVHVDGGGDLSSDAGSGETTLDVEQSGGIAPDANIVVYDAPNTDAGFMDVFYKAVSDNLVNTLSVSWGSPEALYMANGQTNEVQAFDQAFMEAAAQGISTFAASGDSGAYDTNRGLPYPYFSKVVGADVPSSDPYITAAGGTTLPTTLQMKHGPVSTGNQERAWTWDYFSDYLSQNYGPSAIYDLGYFSVGGGGAVSSIWSLPSYQRGVAGTTTTPSGQSLMDETQTPPVDYVDLPSGFAGRNTPDVSMNADPETGYLVYSSTDGGWIAEGGTSFVAPQLNGITALINQSVGQSVGFLNPQLYALEKGGHPYGTNAPFNDITAGDNWYYNATSGYDNATGIGTPNVANLAAALKGKR